MSRALDGSHRCLASFMAHLLDLFDRCDRLHEYARHTSPYQCQGTNNLWPRNGSVKVLSIT